MSSCRSEGNNAKRCLLVVFMVTILVNTFYESRPIVLSFHEITDTDRMLPVPTSVKEAANTIWKEEPPVSTMESDESQEVASLSNFSGLKIREYQGRKLGNTILKSSQLSFPNQSFNCTETKWIVMIVTPSSVKQAVLRAISLSDWCTVLVAHADTPANYSKDLEEQHASETIRSKAMPKRWYFLSLADQQKLMSKEDSNGGVYQEMTRAASKSNKYAQKSLGYLFAIQQSSKRAKIILDLADDVLLELDSEGHVKSPLVHAHDTTARMAAIGNTQVINPHSLLGWGDPASGSTSWPRGFPSSRMDHPDSISSYKDRGSKLFSKMNTTKQTLSSSSYSGFVAFDDEPWTSIDDPTTRVAVVQLSIQKDPDRDAILRQIQANGTVTTTSSTTPLVVPTHHIFGPYSEQATLHAHKAHWALLLPTTVSDRMSDVWRGYFAQTLFRLLGLQLAYSPSDDILSREPPSEARVMDYATKEAALHAKTDLLLDFLHQWNCNSTTLPECMEQLWIDLYEHQYIELADVHLVQWWLGALAENGYKFPAMAKRQRHDEIVLMGQFNFNNSLPDIIFWHQTYRQFFKHVVIRGPFSVLQLREMHENGILAYKGMKDGGFVSPMQNLARTLKQYQGRDDIAGVLYSHDDAIVDIDRLLGKYPVSGNHVIATFNVRDPRTPNTSDTKQLDSLNKESYKIEPNGEFVKQDGFRSKDVKKLSASLRGWIFRNKCTHAYLNVVNDPRADRYRDDDGSFVVPAHGQSDFLYAPVHWADAFIEIAELLVDHKLFLECSFPSAVDALRHTFGASVQTAKLCTEWKRSKRGGESMISNCLGARKSGNPFHVYHPFKIGSHGYRKWSKTVAKVAA